MKIGTKMHSGMEKSNALGAKPFRGDLLLSSSMTACHENKVRFLHFEFIK